MPVINTPFGQIRYNEPGTVQINVPGVNVLGTRSGAGPGGAPSTLSACEAYAVAQKTGKSAAVLASLKAKCTQSRLTGAFRPPSGPAVVVVEPPTAAAGAEPAPAPEGSGPSLVTIAAVAAVAAVGFVVWKKSRKGRK